MSGDYRTFYKYKYIFNVDTSHFLGQRYLSGNKRNLPKQPLELHLVENSFFSPKNLKKRLIQEKYLEYKCQNCGIDSWKGHHLSLQLDHINGNKFDNRLENLRILCPNYHSQTDTFCAKNRTKQNNNKKPNTRICACGNVISYSSVMCAKCTYKKREKISWPSDEWLLSRIQETSYKQVSRELGVSDNAIRKRLSKSK